MKKLFFTFLLIHAFISLGSVNGFAQQHDSVLIVIESPEIAALSQIPQFKIYYHDDDQFLGEIEKNDLSLLDSFNINYQIIDEQGWSGEYYVLTQRPYGPSLKKIETGDIIYITDNKSVVKIDKSKEYELFTGDYQLEKITRFVKPLPPSIEFTITLPAVTDSIVRNIIDQVSAAYLEDAVQRLQDFKTRYTHSDSIIPAAQWIYDQYRSFGLTDVEFDTFYINSVPHRNVVATKHGLIYPDSVILIGGHYDSIVLGPGTNYHVYAPGADDNASGTVAGIEAARVFANHDFEATIKFVAWDAEEVGLVGSQAYAQRAYYNNEPITLYINLDMIGNLNRNDPLRNVTIYADPPTMPFAELMADMAKKYTSLVPFIPGNSGGSDHRSFQSWDFRALFGQEGDFSPHWHQLTDVTDNMDFDYMREVVQISLAAIIHLAGPASNFHGTPYVKYNAHSVDDDMNGSSFGNGNGYIDAGETFELSLTVKNFGDSTANDVTATLVSSDQFVNIINANQSFGSISSNNIATSQNNFVFQVSQDVSSGHKINFKINITDSKGNNWEDRFNVKVIMPELVYHQQDVKEMNGNGDDKIDPGETFNLFVELENIGLRDAKNITSILKCDHPSITILDSLANFEVISQYGYGKNSHDQFTIEIEPEAEAEIIPFSLEVSEDGGFYKTTIAFNLAVGQGKILIVEDDGRFNLSHYYRDALDILGIPYLFWDTSTLGPVLEDTLIAYSRVIWYIGQEFGNSLFRHGTKLLENYLENGGNLFINGSLFAFSVRDSLLMSEYLKAKYISFKTDLHHLKSENSNSVFGDIDFWLAKSGENNQSLAGEIDALSIAQPILFYDTNTSEGAGNIQSSGAAAVAIANDNYRAIMFSFGWEGIEDRQIRQNVLVKVLNWLQGVIASVDDNFTDIYIPDKFELLPNYPNPFNPSTTIQFHVPRTSHVTIKIFNVLGREIKTLLDTEIQAGQHKMLWNGKNEQNQQVTSGVYFYQMKAGDFQMTRKMILLY